MAPGGGCGETGADEARGGRPRVELPLPSPDDGRFPSHPPSCHPLSSELAEVCELF